MKRTWLLTLSIICIGIGSLVQADNHPDFSGVWRTDLNDPESTLLSPLLKAQGASWMECKAADSIPVIQRISQTETKLIIEVDGGIYKKTEVLLLDGTLEITKRDRVGEVEVRSFWDKDGKRIVTVAKYKTQSGENAVWTSTRALVYDGNGLKIDHFLVIEEGPGLKATRMLRKRQ